MVTVAYTKEEQAILDAFTNGKGVGYVDGLRAERARCVAILERWIDSLASEPEMEDILKEIKGGK